MASRTSRKEWVRGLPWAFGMCRYERKRFHWASERSVRYGFLIGDSVRNHPNPHPYQTGSYWRDELSEFDHIVGAVAEMFGDWPNWRAWREHVGEAYREWEELEPLEGSWTERRRVG